MKIADNKKILNNKKSDYKWKWKKRKLQMIRNNKQQKMNKKIKNKKQITNDSKNISNKQHKRWPNKNKQTTVEFHWNSR